MGMHIFFQNTHDSKTQTDNYYYPIFINVNKFCNLRKVLRKLLKIKIKRTFLIEQYFISLIYYSVK